MPADAGVGNRSSTEIPDLTSDPDRKTPEKKKQSSSQRPDLAVDFGRKTGTGSVNRSPVIFI